jgi:hypothetical protein
MLTSLARSCRMLMFVCSREEDEAEFLKFCFVSFFEKKKEKQHVSLVSMPRRGSRKSKCVSSFSGITVYIYQQNWGGASLLALLTVACVTEGKSLPRNRYAFAEAGNSSSSTVVRLRSTEAELWPTNTTTQRRRDGCQLLLTSSSSILACWPAVL